jgi:hypothetical protein
MGVTFCRETLARKVGAHIKRAGISATRFGYEAAGDPGFVRKLHRGHDFRMSTLERVQAFLKNQKITEGKP